jgi:hypothetical protein
LFVCSQASPVYWADIIVNALVLRRQLHSNSRASEYSSVVLIHAALLKGSNILTAVPFRFQTRMYNAKLVCIRVRIML